MLKSSGEILGVTQRGGLNDAGIFYELVNSGNGKWVKRTLYDFSSGVDLYPKGGLASDSDGNLYGTSGAGALGYGSVFELTPVSGGWTEQSLYSFGREGNALGPYPNPHLAVDTKGNLYGSTEVGGLINEKCGEAGCGFVFRLGKKANGSWNFKTIHAFTAGTTDGATPRDGVIVDASGNVYGTTQIGGGGGTYCNAGTNVLYCGVVFQLSPQPDGTFIETILHSFTGSPDGAQSFARPLLDPEGNLYGTATWGGTGVCGSVGCGTVWEIAP